MYGSLYPPMVKNYLKLVPSCTMFLYFMAFHPVIIWNVLNHSKERIEKQYFSRTPFEKELSRRDDYLRLAYVDLIEWQPSSPKYGKQRIVKF